MCIRDSTIYCDGKHDGDATAGVFAQWQDAANRAYGTSRRITASKSSAPAPTPVDEALVHLLSKLRPGHSLGGRTSKSPIGMSLLAERAVYESLRSEQRTDLNERRGILDQIRELVKVRNRYLEKAPRPEADTFRAVLDSIFASELGEVEK